MNKRRSRGTTRRVRDGVEQKRCSAKSHRGARWLPLTEFQADATQPDGLKYACRTCHNRGQEMRDDTDRKRQAQRDRYHADVESSRADRREQKDEYRAKNDLRALETVELAERDAVADARVAGELPGRPNRPYDAIDRGPWARKTPDEIVDDLNQVAQDIIDETDEQRNRRDRIAERERLREERAARDRAERLASDTAPLRPEDFDEDDDVGVANDPRGGRLSAEHSREKRQEYNRAMGQHAHHVRAAAAAELRGDGDLLDMPSSAGKYIGALAEQEARFGRRRLARSLSLFAAGEEQARRLWAQACRQYLTGRVVPTGYAARPSSKPIKRSVCLLLSDLHIGADLKGGENPLPYRAIEEARRLEFVLRQALDYKPQYRADSELVLMLNGDLIEGLLMHDFRDGAPLTEQKVAFHSYMERFVGECARAYPKVRVFCQPGNHGRDKVRHPGRATSAKWDSHEASMAYALSRACSALKNVTWDIPFRAVTAINLHGSILGLAHGDTEPRIGDPDTKAAQNAQTLAEINSANIYGVQFDAWAIGHFHKPRMQPRKIRQVFNGALIPPNGHARSSGYTGEVCGQWIWESVAGHVVGDSRFIEVGRAQDTDERLGTIIRPMRFDLDAGGFPT